jgi:hypothetical protein
MEIPGPPLAGWPAVDDIEGWKAFVAIRNEFVMSMVGDLLAGFAGTVAALEDDTGHGQRTDALT